VFATVALILDVVQIEIPRGPAAVHGAAMVIAREDLPPDAWRDRGRHPCRLRRVERADELGVTRCALDHLGTDLDLLLRSKRIENLICCGVTTHVCVMSTVFTARNLDYRVLLPRDAVAAVSAAHQQAALLCMSDVFAYITTCEGVMALWSDAEATDALRR
jgi:nicotinamidase-related amidase